MLVALMADNTLKTTTCNGTS